MESWGDAKQDLLCSKVCPWFCWIRVSICVPTICVTPLSFSPIRIKQITLMIKTNRPSHSDPKKLDHFNEITYHLLLSQLSIKLLWIFPIVSF